jgi:hypothetical protein
VAELRQRGVAEVVEQLLQGGSALGRLLQSGPAVVSERVMMPAATMPVGGTACNGAQTHRCNACVVATVVYVVVVHSMHSVMAGHNMLE